MRDCLEAAHYGHVQIEKDDIGPVAFDYAQSGLAVIGFAYDLDVAEVCQFFTQDAPGHRFVIDKKHSHREHFAL